MNTIDQNNIRLIKIEEDRHRDQPSSKNITFRYEHHGDSLTATFVVGENQVRDEMLVSVARDWLHKTCKDIAHATEGWAMDDDQLKAADHPYKDRQRHPFS
jgi:hypothetical protein